MKFQIATVAAALLFVLAALVAGDPRGAAVTGAAIAGATAVASIFAMGRAARSPRNATKNALAVMAVVFLVRLLLVALGTVRVGRAGAIAYVVAFFVPYFAFAAIEGGYVHALGKNPGRTA